MRVELVDSLGTDLTVVNAARVSFKKHRDTWLDSDERLIKYLAQHGHWTPFGHPLATFWAIGVPLEPRLCRNALLTHFWWKTVPPDGSRRQGRRDLWRLGNTAFCSPHGGFTVCF